MKIKGEKISWIISRFCEGNADFARKLGEKPNTISNWVKRGVSLNVYEKIIEHFPDINTDWLIRDLGNPLRDGSQGESCESIPGEPETIYHYTDLKGFLGIISSGYIRLSALEKANDKCEVFNKSGYNYASFCMDGEVEGGLNPCMWARYGDEYFGVCIGFNLSKLKQINSTESFLSFPIEYKGIDEIKHNTSDEKGLRYKLSVWEHENEYRFIHERKNALSFNYDCITKIYVPQECSSNFRDIITSVGLNSKIYGIWFVNGLPKESILLNNASVDIVEKYEGPLGGFKNAKVYSGLKKEDCAEPVGRVRAGEFLEKISNMIEEPRSLEEAKLVIKRLLEEVKQLRREVHSEKMEKVIISKREIG
ncbi:DUF2971 domain-containing protein [Bacteroides pyogenes]|uniref:DUF2971 domain-containing protein n=1 Tax=Bacteroides pyogenes TaxID=310300 RepID=UPI001BAA05DC|nr:DUF2971 domain-containing protein [Bacteroides pyogenes]